ncbi:hypothetical protein M8C21_015928, partial [Ambrosia artemisiifolia]
VKENDNGGIIRRLKMMILEYDVVWYISQKSVQVVRKKKLGKSGLQVVTLKRKVVVMLKETNLCWLIGMFLLGSCAPFVYHPDAFRVSVVLSLLSGFGVTLGYHRLLTHRSFKVPKLVEYFFAYCGVHALQRDPIVWVRTHKLHHKHADTQMDPNAPTQGVWLSYLGWFLYNNYVATKKRQTPRSCGEKSNVSELEAQGFYRFLNDTYFWHPTALATLLYLYGGFPYLAWGMGMRITILHLTTYIQNSVNHRWGERAWNTPDTSTNSWYVGVDAMFGRGLA